MFSEQPTLAIDATPNDLRAIAIARNLMRGITIDGNTMPEYTMTSLHRLKGMA